MQQFSFGQNLASETLSANSRLMLNMIAANTPAQTILSKSYTFNSPNNGNITQISDNLNGGKTQIFGYDYLNRLTSAKTSATTGPDAWNESYSIDPWGNLKQDGNDSFVNINFDASNRISATGYTYDAAGNLLADTFHNNPRKIAAEKAFRLRIILGYAYPIHPISSNMPAGIPNRIPR